MGIRSAYELDEWTDITSGPDPRGARQAATTSKDRNPRERSATIVVAHLPETPPLPQKSDRSEELQADKLAVFRALLHQGIRHSREGVEASSEPLLSWLSSLQGNYPADPDGLPHPTWRHAPEGERRGIGERRNIPHAVMNVLDRWHDSELPSPADFLPPRVVRRQLSLRATLSAVCGPEGLHARHHRFTDFRAFHLLSYVRLVSDPGEPS